MTTGEIDETFSREMGYTRREFLANLDSALKGSGYDLVADNVVEIPLDEGRLRIRLGPEKQRRIASLAVPVMDVEFAFDGVGASARRDFYRAFWRSFQKGGG